MVPMYYKVFFIFLFQVSARLSNRFHSPLLERNIRVKVAEPNYKPEKFEPGSVAPYDDSMHTVADFIEGEVT